MPSSGWHRCTTCPADRRLASGTGERACAWAFVALGLAEKDKAGARRRSTRRSRRLIGFVNRRRTPNRVPSARGPGDASDEPRRIDPASRRADRPGTAGRGLLAGPASMLGSTPTRKTASEPPISGTSACCWLDTTVTWPPYSSSRWIPTSSPPPPGRAEVLIHAKRHRGQGLYRPEGRGRLDGSLAAGSGFGLRTQPTTRGLPLPRRWANPPKNDGCVSGTQWVPGSRSTIDSESATVRTASASREGVDSIRFRTSPDHPGRPDDTDGREEAPAMWTMMIPVVAAALLAQPADPVTVAGVVVDPAGKPVSDVEVVLAGTETHGWIGPHAGTVDDRRSRGIPPRGRPATVDGNRAMSV